MRGGLPGMAEIGGRGLRVGVVFYFFSYFCLLFTFINYFSNIFFFL
jgi:hypothetical protein